MCCHCLTDQRLHKSESIRTFTERHENSGSTGGQTYNRSHVRHHLHRLVGTSGYSNNQVSIGILHAIRGTCFHDRKHLQEYLRIICVCLRDAPL